MVNSIADFFTQKDNFKKYHHVQSCRVIGTPNDTFYLVTVVIPTYNRPQELKNAIESVLRQTGDFSFCILVVDNDNTANSPTEQLVRSYESPRIQYYKNNKNIGQIGNWNRGIELSNSEWIVLLHDDDQLLPDYFNEIFATITRRPQIQGLAVLYRDILLVSGDDTSCLSISAKKRGLKKMLYRLRDIRKGFSKNKVARLTLHANYLDSGYTAPIGPIYRKKSVMALGGFNEYFFPISDWVFHVNYAMNYPFYILCSQLALRGIGVNESIKIENRIRFVEYGYYFRKAIHRKIRTLLGDWWNQSLSWYHAQHYHYLEQPLSFLNPKYKSRFYLSLYRVTFVAYRFFLKY